MGSKTNPVAARFGQTLYVYRRRAGISQGILGEITSLHRTEIGLLERGQREPRLNTIIRLAGALAIPIQELFVGIEWKTDKGEFEVEELDDATIK